LPNLTLYTYSSNKINASSALFNLHSPKFFVSRFHMSIPSFINFIQISLLLELNFWFRFVSFSSLFELLLSIICPMLFLIPFCIRNEKWPIISFFIIFCNYYLSRYQIWSFIDQLFQFSSVLQVYTPKYIGIGFVEVLVWFHDATFISFLNISIIHSRIWNGSLWSLSIIRFL
jgi:hypothetical protein